MLSTICVLANRPCKAAEYETQAFPSAHELFPQLQADPAEPHFEFSFGFPVSYHGVALVNVGDYLGIYRWALGESSALQLNIGGAIDTRFDATTDHNLQDVDFYGNVPLDYRIGWFSLRSMFYHTSSHLGDDYLRVNNIQDENNSWEAYREIASAQVNKALRIYGGYQQAIHTKPNWDGGHQAVQGGTEIYFNTSDKGFWHPYWANDVQSWARSNWDVTWASQLGFKTGDEYSRGRGISYFVSYQMGPRYEGQFYQKKENIWGIGLKFLLSDRPLQPSPTPTPPQTGPEPTSETAPAVSSTTVISPVTP